MTENEAKQLITDLAFDGERVNGKEFKALQKAAIALAEIQQYRAIGTVEECQTAVERMKPKKPIWKPIYEWEEDCGWWHCPNCNDILTALPPTDNETFYFHCLNCGQTFDWEESEERNVET